MSFKTVLFVSIAFAVGCATSASYASDAISCDSFEGCADGSVDVTNQLLQMQAEIAALQGLVGTLQSELDANSAADTLAHHTKYTGAESIAAVGPHFSGNHADLTNVVAAQHHTSYTDAEAISAVGPHSPDYSALLAGVSRGVDPNTTQDTLTFTNMNVQVVSGSGGTGGTVTGTGNVIIGYNESRGSSDCPDGPNCDRRTGSHMLVIGTRNNYRSYGGMVVGNFNETSQKGAVVSGGENNTASSFYASVSGGQNNSASSFHSSVSGGAENTASRQFSSVSGGRGNSAENNYASVSGGIFNTASGTESSVSGGRNNYASETKSSVSGGANNTASGTESSVSGGRFNVASGTESSVSGGTNNYANGQYSSVSGGESRTATAAYCTEGDSGTDC